MFLGSPDQRGAFEHLRRQCHTGKVDPIMPKIAFSARIHLKISKRYVIWRHRLPVWSQGTGFCLQRWALMHIQSLCPGRPYQDSEAKNFTVGHSYWHPACSTSHDCEHSRLLKRKQVPP